MRTNVKKAIQLIIIITLGILMVATVAVFARKSADNVAAMGPIPPPEGYPKLSLSTKVVTPTLASPDGAVLEYRLTILNTGAYPAEDVTLTDKIPMSTTYNLDAESSAPPNPVFIDGMILWEGGHVGFDSSVVITFSVTVSNGVEGKISNTAVIDDPAISSPVTVTAETMVTDHPVFEISKVASPALPGKNKPLTYDLKVTNVGQPADGTPIVVTDFVPDDTSFVEAGQGGVITDGVVTWFSNSNLGFGESSEFTFTVQVGNVPSGTVINNQDYMVTSPEEIAAGKPYTTTVIDPIFILSKSISPDPPGSNREMTYTLTVFNLGSKATDLEISDMLPPDVTYVRGGTESGGVVTWEIPSLDTRESAEVSFTVFVGDIADVIILNGDYSVCSSEGVCAQGLPVNSLIVGPTFEVTAELDPIAHKPGGGETVTPTLTIKNIGPGIAIDAFARLTFGRISVSNLDVLEIITKEGTEPGTLFEGPPCNVGFQCVGYSWEGSLDVGDMITITARDQSTIGGEEGTHYTATIDIVDDLSGFVTEPITATAIGHVTHMSNLIPSKSAPAKIGPGEEMTYNIKVFDSGLSTEATPFLTDTVPSGVTVLSASDGGTWEQQGDETIITWELPAMGPGDETYRSFRVRTDSDLISGSQIINKFYQTSVYESYIKGIKVVTGEPVTTTVHEVGLIDSYKTVSPVWALPGTGTVLTYAVHVVNSGPDELTNVEVNDIFPWEHTTYQRDAVATGGELTSDIVSLQWNGTVQPYSQQVITFTVVVDDFFEGVVTNTATIHHPSLLQDKVVTAVAYITDKPVLRIHKTATPDPVMIHGTLLYQIQVTNLGQQATILAINDTVPANTTYLFGSASSGGALVGDTVQWFWPVLDPGKSVKLTFQVEVNAGREVINADYSVTCKEGVTAVGEPVITRVQYPIRQVLLPFTFKQ